MGAVWAERLSWIRWAFLKLQRPQPHLGIRPDKAKYRCGAYRPRQPERARSSNGSKSRKAARRLRGVQTQETLLGSLTRRQKSRQTSVKANNIDVANLSAISANLGTVTAGSLKSNTTIDVMTDLGVGENVNLRTSTTNTIRALNFIDRYGYVTGRIFDDPASELVIIQSVSASPGITLDGDIIGFGDNYNIQFEDFSETLFVTKKPEKGFCGVGNREQTAISTGVASTGVGVNFRIRKNYTPSSVDFTTSPGTTSAKYAESRRTVFGSI